MLFGFCQIYQSFLGKKKQLFQISQPLTARSVCKQHTSRNLKEALVESRVEKETTPLKSEAVAE